MPRTAVRIHGRIAARQIDIQIGRRIRERRETLGISRETLAGALGLSAEQLRRLEAGIASVVASRLYWLGIILAIPTDAFFETRSLSGGGGPIPTERDRHDGQLGPSAMEVQRMVEAVRRIPDSEARAGLIALVTTIVEMARPNGVLPN